MMQRTTSRTRLALESLEARETPAGVVNVTFNYGSVVLTGDAENNFVTICTNSDDRVVIGDGEHGTTFRLNGAEPSAEVTLPGELTGGVAIRMLDGTDSLTVSNLHVPGSMRIHGGEGDNLVDVTGPLSVAKSLSIVNGAGLDELHVRGRLEVGGHVSISNRSGGSELHCYENSIFKAGGLSVINGDGFDRLELHGIVVVLGNFGIRNGAGGSIVADVLYAGIGVLGVLSIINGAGADEIALTSGLSVKAEGGILIRHGPGSSDTKITPTETLYTGRNLSVVAGSDVDRVQLGGTYQAAKFEVRGSVLLNTGDGNGSFEMNPNKLTVGGGIVARAGNGQDVVSISSAEPGTVGGGVTVALGAGANQSAFLEGVSIGRGLWVTTAGDRPVDQPSVSLSRTHVGLGTTIRTGAANDLVNIGGCTFDSTVNISTGAGNDRVAIEANPFTSLSRFNGTVRVRTGDGDDSVLVGQESFGVPTFAVFAAATYWDGGLGTGDHVIIEPFNVFAGPQPVKVGFEA